MSSENKRIINAAIIEDEDDSFAALTECCDRYSAKRGVGINVKRFGNAADFLEKYSADYDVVFMDIMLPGLNGMDAARRLRAVDSKVALVFVTSMRRFAVEGYEVSALDFIVKPVEYASFEPKLDRVMAYIFSQADDVLSIVTRRGIIKADVNKIMYVEVMDHDLVYHTTDGDINSYGSLSKIEQQLKNARFVRCNSYLLVNPRYVTGIDSANQTTTVGGKELKISYNKRAEYRKAVMEYLSGGM